MPQEYGDVLVFGSSKKFMETDRNIVYMSKKAFLKPSIPTDPIQERPEKLKQSLSLENLDLYTNTLDIILFRGFHQSLVSGCKYCHLVIISYPILIKHDS